MKRYLVFMFSMMAIVLSACQPVGPAKPTHEVSLPSGSVELYPVDNQTTPDFELSYTPEGCVENFEPGVNYFPKQATVNYAQGFSIEYHDNYKLLTVTQPWAGADQSFQYILLQCGTPLPEKLNDAMVIEVPIRSLVTMSTTYFSFLEQVGVLDALVGVDDLTYVYNERVHEMAKNDQIQVVGGGAGGGVASVETLIELDPDVIMTSASGYADYDAHPKLLEAGLPVVINGDYVENTPLGRAEWGKFIAAFFNKEVEAEKQFNEMAGRYEALKTLTAGLEEKPSVFVNTDFQGSWYMPGGESYAAILLKDAGADYLWADSEGTGAMPYSFEQVYELALEADFWLNVGFASELGSLLAMDERYADFSAFRSGNVYNYSARVNANGGSDYFESGVAQPDVILADLISIFHPGLLTDHLLVYYMKLQ